MKTSKGFFFVLVSLLIVSYIFTITYLWVKQVEVSEDRYSDLLLGTSVNNVFSHFSEDRMSNILGMYSTYSFYQLVNHSILHPMKANIGDEQEVLNYTMASLILNCSSDPDVFSDSQELTIREGACFSDLFSELNNSLHSSGYSISSINLKSFSFEETEDPLLFNVSLVFNLSVSDAKNNVVFYKNYSLSSYVNATSFPDPLLARKSYSFGLSGENLPILKPVYLAPISEYGNPNEQIDRLQPFEVSMHSYNGQGWFYGSVLRANDYQSVSESSRHRYALFGTYDEILAIPSDIRNQFGAYIVQSAGDPLGNVDRDSCTGTEEPMFNRVQLSEEEGNCEAAILGQHTTKPFAMVDSSVSLNSFYAGELSNPSIEDSSYRILFVSKHSPSEILDEPMNILDSEVRFYNIEHLRDYAICSYYIRNPENAPSYAQRLFEDSEQRSSSNGIETTLLGTWFGGSLNSESTRDPLNSLSRVDLDAYRNNEGRRIRGMPGCRDSVMCSIPTPLGNFRLGESHGLQYYPEHMSDWFTNEGGSYSYESD